MVITVIDLGSNPGHDSKKELKCSDRTHENEIWGAVFSFIDIVKNKISGSKVFKFSSFHVDGERSHLGFGK